MDKTIELLKQALARTEAMKVDFEKASQLFEQGMSLLKKHLNAEMPKGIDLSVLSDRELEIMKLIGQKISKRDIAQRLDIKEKSVRVHCDRIRAKLNVEKGYEVDIIAQQKFGQLGTNVD